MQHRLGRFFTVLSLALWCNAPAALAGAWAYPKNTGQVISTTLYDTAQASFDDDGKARVEADYTKWDQSIYLEHGLTSRWTLIFKPSYQDVDLQTTAGPEKFSGLGPTSLGVQRLLWSSGTRVLSAQGSVIFASEGENVPEASLGQGGTDYELRLLAGQSLTFGDARGFAEIQAAYRQRSGPSPSERRLDITGGYRPSEPLQIMAQAFVLDAQGAQFPLRNYRSLKGQLSLVRELKGGRSVQLGAFKTLAGRNIIEEKGALIAIWQRY